jgi:acetolactate synthase-1/2/3 large subunit
MNLIVAGRGALSAWKELREYAERTMTYVVCSMGGIGVMPSDHVLYLGMLGHTGDKRANQAVADADTIICLGTRLDMRQTGTALGRWQGKRVIMVNTDPMELAKARVPLAASHHMTVKEWLRVHNARGD